jgi:hypothetical protein
MIRMDMCIDYEPNVFIGQRSDCRENLVRQRRELIVDHDDAVGADQYSDVTSASLEIVNVSRGVVRDDLHGCKIVVLRERGARRKDCHCPGA